jgi:DNA-binding Xre family transcriptional regulator
VLRLRIKEVAEQKRISMTKLSYRAEVSYNTIKSYYQNPYRPFSSVTLERIARALEVSPLDLLEYIPNEGMRPDMGKK